MSADSAELARVFTVPASVPFLPALVRALVDGELVPGLAPGADPLALSAVTLYLPTRRACRLARDVFEHEVSVSVAREAPRGRLEQCSPGAGASLSLS